MEEPQQFTFWIRYPSWSEKGIEISINGHSQPVEAKPGSFLSIDREWNDGDIVEVQIPFGLRLESMPDDSNRIAIFYGPLVLAGDLGPVGDSLANSFQYVPVFLREERSPGYWMEAVENEINTFKTVNAGHPRDIIFKPFYKIHDRRYSVYFDLYSQDKYQQYLEGEQLKTEARQALDALTYDGFQPGDSLDEMKHRFRGDKLNILTDFKGRSARGAERGGWLSFELSVPNNGNVDLIIEYWGGFTGGKTFDIVVDGIKIATENISGKSDGEFVNESYPLPSVLLENKEKIIIRFEPHTGSRAGPFFYARTVEKK